MSTAPKKIEKKIVGFKVVDKSEKPAPEPVIPDDDPGIKRIERRPEGELQAISKKVSYNTAEGKQKIYLLISFMEVTGVLDGQEVTIERPIEFFFPVGQGTSEHQWISATMRSLSLAARGGYVAQNLQDMLKVSWDKGPVRYGVNQWDKPIFHNSEVAAIAYAIQETLRERGFVDADGNQVPTRVLARKYAKAPEPEEQEVDADPEPEPEFNHFEPIGEPAPAGPSGKSASGVIGECSCGGDLRLRDGCPTCDDCGWSKC